MNLLFIVPPISPASECFKFRFVSSPPSVRDNAKTERRGRPSALPTDVARPRLRGDFVRPRAGKLIRDSIQIALGTGRHLR
jgi:hypothetical protein